MKVDAKPDATTLAVKRGFNSTIKADHIENTNLLYNLITDISILSQKIIEVLKRDNKLFICAMEDQQQILSTFLQS